MKINLRYFSAFLILLVTEIFIGFFVNDAIIRPYIGDDANGDLDGYKTRNSAYSIW